MKLTEREKQILDKIVEVDSIKTAASALGISPATIYNILYRLREKQRKARLFINRLLPYRRHRLLKKVLAPKLTVQEEELTRDVWGDKNE